MFLVSMQAFNITKHTAAFCSSEVLAGELQPIPLENTNSCADLGRNGTCPPVQDQQPQRYEYAVGMFLHVDIFKAESALS
jgi:hypothetical protein